jgi:orotate phosphoribosyltransferase
VRFGEFRLASGRTSSYYCDGKLVTFSPQGSLLIADAILAELEGIDLAALGGMDMGATPIVSAVALRSQQIGRPLPTFIVRKTVKAHGTMKEIEGLVPATPSRIAVVDDVITSGGSIIQAIEAIRRAGHEVVLALSVLDRDGGGEQALHGLGVPYRPLVTIAELGISNDAAPQESAR